MIFHRPTAPALKQACKALADTMALTGHKSVQSLMGHARGTTTRAAVACAGYSQF